MKNQFTPFMGSSHYYILERILFLLFSFSSALLVDIASVILILGLIYGLLNKTLFNVESRKELVIHVVSVSGRT